MKKLLSGKRALGVIEEYSEVLLPQLAPLSRLNLPVGSCEGNWFSLLLAIFALSSDTPARDFDSAMHSLRSDNATRTLGVGILTAHSCGLSLDSRASMLAALRDFGEGVLRGLLVLRRLLGEDTALAERVLDEALASGLPYLVSMLTVNGADMISLGVVGRGVGELLLAILDATIEGKLSNEREAALEFARRRISKN